MSEPHHHNLDWLKEFEEELGRPLRILHVGNIANNGYLNTKAMREIGLHADCLAHDYYHIMGMPEWVDLSLSIDLGDDFHPDWWKLDDEDYVRPSCFIYGPKNQVIAELNSVFSREQNSRAWSRYNSMINAWVFSFYQSSMIRGSKLSFAAKWRRQTTFFRRLLDQNERDFRRIALELGVGHIDDHADAFRRKRMIIATLLRNRLRETVTQFFARARWTKKPYQFAVGVSRTLFVFGFRIFALPLFKLTSRVKLFFSQRGAGTGGVSETGNETLDRRSLDITVDGATETPPLNRGQFSRTTRLVYRTFGKIQGRSRLQQQLGMYQHSDARFRQQWSAAFPSGSDAELEEDLMFSSRWVEHFDKVFNQYDAVVYYATFPVMGLIVSDRPFYAYEHGTLRTLPFENSLNGRITRLGYKSADAAFITNLDNIAAADRMGIPQEKQIYVPHMIDDRALLEFLEAHNDVRPDPDTCTFFSPSRQDWLEPDNLNMTKGSDKVLHAAARLKAEGKSFRLVLVEWGRHLDESKKLIEELGISENVTWVPVMEKSKLWHHCLSSNAVLDQYIIPAFGTVTVDALFLGLPVISYLAEEEARRFFGKCPPILNSFSADDIYHSMVRVMELPREKAGSDPEITNWAREYHSTRRTLALQLNAMRPAFELSVEKAKNEKG